MIKQGSAWGINDLNLKDFLLEKKSCVISNPGNAGDALIALGTLHYFDAVAPGKVEFIPGWDMSNIKNYDVIFYSGGGNLVPYYNYGIEFIQRAIELRKEIIILPHTTFGYEDLLIKMKDYLKIICRDRVSYNLLIKAGMPFENVGLDHDMAFHINNGFYSKYISDSGNSGTLYCLRTDAERKEKSIELPEKNIDISLSWNGDYWHNRNLVEAVCQSLFAFVCPFDNIITDRLHIAILGSLLGRPVVFGENAYFKNNAVYEYSKKFMQSVIISENLPFNDIQ